MKLKTVFTAIAVALLMACGVANAYVLTPQPQEILYEGAGVTFDASNVVLSSEFRMADPRLTNSLKEIFPDLTISDSKFASPDGGLFIHLASTRDEFVNNNCSTMFCAMISPGSFGGQEYFLGVKKIKNNVAVLIMYNRKEVENGVGDSYGAYYAIKTLAQLYNGDGSLPEISIHDWPDFEIRGILEGFYGKPWPDDGRNEMIDWISDYKMNIFLYTPKDDHKLRFGWRSKLTDKELAEVKAVNDLASDNYVRYCWSLSPGVSINFSNPKDLKSAYFKFKSVIEQGVKCFSLAFDDVGPTLTPYDRDNYETYWQGQVEFSNRVVGKLLDEYPDVTIAFVPNDYWGNLAMESEYLRYLGENLDQRMNIGWTGDEIAPDRITAEDAVFYEFFIKRPPFLGDNFPVLDNVTKDSGRLALGPLTSRDPRLCRYVKGFTGNSMPLPISSKPAYVTMADFTWNAFNYDAERSWVNAMMALTSEETYEPLMFFARQSRSSLIWSYDAMELNEETRGVLMAFNNEFNYDMQVRAPALRATLERFTGIGAELEALRNPEISGMLDEMQQWVSKLEDYGRVGLNALDLLEKKHAGESIPAADIDALEAEWQKVEENKAVITRMVMFNFMKSAIALLRGEDMPEKEKLPSLLGE